MKQIIFIVIFALLLPAIAMSQLQPAPGELVYKKSCAACHDSGMMGAPKFGDKAAWVHRIGEGMETMYNSALHGDGAMPAKGGNSALSDAEVKGAVDYLISKSK